MNIILLSLIAGVVGMGIGAILTALFGTKTDRMTSIFLSFAGGVMMSIVFLELIPESVELSNVPITVIGIAAGVAMVFFLNNVVDKISSKKNGEKIHKSFAEFFHSSDVIAKRKSMLRSGMIMLFAIGLHNVPEGLAMGAAGQHDAALGFTIAVLIALHNIPEGMAVAVPLTAGGMSKIKSIVITALVGATTIIGAFIGVLVGGISETAVGISFAIASGAMLYVVLAEILPHAIMMSRNRLPTVFALVGIVVGMLFIAIV